jgi:16S rRNA (cytosine967-C5)-methyltransferase
MTLKLFPNLLFAVARALHDIFIEKQYADKVIERVLKSNPKWGARDRGFIAETTYDIVRNYRFLSEMLGHKPTTEADFYLLFGIWKIMNREELPEWAEFKGLEINQLYTRRRKIITDRRVRESIPNWLDALGETELGEKWEPTIKALNEQARVIIRTNTLRVERKNLIKILSTEGIETTPVGDDGLILEKRTNLFRTEAFREGFFEVQDFSSQSVAPFLAPEPGMRVVDACAGGGGKTLHLAAIMKNKGTILALDTEEWKLGELRKRARRALCDIIETRAIESTKTIKRLHNSADRLLLDVPCSGLGVLRRNPDAKWKLKPDFIEKVRGIQAQILQQYSLIVKPGGRLVYATCSILPSENDEQVAKFLESSVGQQFFLIQERKILPQDEGFDGFYMALLERKADENTVEKPKKAEKKPKIAVESAEMEVLDTISEKMNAPKKSAKKTTEKSGLKIVADAPIVLNAEIEPEIIVETAAILPKKTARKKVETAEIEPEIIVETAILPKKTARKKTV